VYAGMNRIDKEHLELTGGVPRVRGDEPHPDYRAVNVTNEFPVYAGMNRLRDHVGNGVCRVPRVRGDEPERPVGPQVGAASSPCTRG